MAIVNTLYMVATPIGNLKDITYRAVEVLKGVDLVACEDTRRTVKLLTALDIKKPLVSVRSQNEVAASVRIVRELSEGRDVAYASDAGTPGVSDPGARLVRAVRDAGFAVIPVPGVSALTALVSVSGFPGKAVTFEGFLSPKQGKRKSRISELLRREDSFVLYESPFRIVKLLKDIADLDPEAKILIGREMTKTFEEFVEGTASDVYTEFSGRKEIRGEFAALVSGSKKS